MLLIRLRLRDLGHLALLPREAERSLIDPLLGELDVRIFIWQWFSWYECRDYPPPTEYRGRPPSPSGSRYNDYPARAGSAEPARYRYVSRVVPLDGADL